MNRTNLFLFIFLLTLVFAPKVDGQRCGGGSFKFTFYNSSGSITDTIKYKASLISLENALKIMSGGKTDMSDVEQAQCIRTIDYGVVLDTKYVDSVIKNDKHIYTYLNANDTLSFFFTFEQERKDTENKAIADGLIKFRTVETIFQPYVLKVYSNNHHVYILANLYGGCNKSMKVHWDEPNQGKADVVTGRDKAKIYYLKKKTVNSDINPKIISSDNDFLHVKDLFEPIEGKYNYYQFIATFRGLSFTGEVEVFHDIIILKTDDSNKILDAYQYTLEWAEWPWQYDLYRSSSENLLLTNDMDVAQLKFKKHWHDEYSDENKDINPETGILKLK